MNPPTSLNRRQFLNSGMRFVLLAGLGSLAIADEAKRLLGTDHNCVHVWTCADCMEFDGCAQPKALDFQKAQLQVNKRPG